MKSIVPFQLAYAVSIHKAQGLEYSSIKVVIPSSNSERITHGIFYTAITRTKEKLKIFWSADTMTRIIEGFKAETKDNMSIEMIKPFLS
ncbi:MAG: ATP-binding domain-containing protein [Oscillospiraceae bacterium]|nr:ATP-binding domain-containing protein [Oscillospiraceae bacterium]